MKTAKFAKYNIHHTQVSRFDNDPQYKLISDTLL